MGVTLIHQREGALADFEPVNVGETAAVAVEEAFGGD